MNSSRKTMFEDVIEFQVAVLKAPRPFIPKLQDNAAFKHLTVCLYEEITELEVAYHDGDLAGVADALADLIYFALGGAYKIGIPFDDVWKVVHEANMRKKRGITKRGKDDDAVKPGEWVDPKTLIKEILNGRL